MPPADDTALLLIRDSLKRVEDKLDHLDLKLDAKADRTDIQDLRLEHEQLTGRVDLLERDRELRKARAEVHQQRDDRATMSLRAKLGFLSGGITMLATLGLAIASFVQTFH